MATRLSVCDYCWLVRMDGLVPVRYLPWVPEECCYCAADTMSGIRPPAADGEVT